MSAAATPLPSAIRVRAPGRLHLGFLDPAGTLGRRFGSLGLVIDGPATVIELRRAARDSAHADEAASSAELARATEHLATLRRATRQLAPLHLHLVETLPAHAGFGSGTQLALAVGRAFSTLFGLALPTAEIARLTGRGLRSGVGIAGFDQGGLLLDGGPRADGAPAALLSRLDLPASWRVLLVLDPRERGLNGTEEKAALTTLPGLPREAAAEICHEVLMRILPGAAGGEFAPFAAGLSRMQRLLGQHFAPAQNGRVYTSAAVGRLIEWVARHTPAGVGQSSWGPTGFAVLPSAEAADTIVDAARAAGVIDPALRLHIVRGCDHGATFETLDSLTSLSA